MKNIVFCGWMGSGKTEAARYVAKEYGYNVISFADGIKMIAKEIFDMQNKQRLLLQQIGEKMREINPDVWIKHTERRLFGKVVVDDLRRANEHKMLAENGFVIARIISDEQKRIERLIGRDGQCDTSLMYNESEIGCDGIQMIEIENNGSVMDFYVKLDKFMMDYVYKS